MDPLFEPHTKQDANSPKRLVLIQEPNHPLNNKIAITIARTPDGSESSTLVMVLGSLEQETFYDKYLKTPSELAQDRLVSYEAQIEMEMLEAANEQMPTNPRDYYNGLPTSNHPYRVYDDTRPVNPTVEVKEDDEKPRFELIPLNALKGAAEVMGYGAKKYAVNNWMGLSPSRLIGAVLRHLAAHNEGMDHMWKNESLVNGNGFPAALQYAITGGASGDYSKEHFRNLCDQQDSGISGHNMLFDPESDLLHLDHAIAGLIMYREVLVNGTISLPGTPRT